MKSDRRTSSPPGCARVSALIFMCLGGTSIEQLLCMEFALVLMAEKVTGRNDGGQSSGEGVPEKGP